MKKYLVLFVIIAIIIPTVLINVSAGVDRASLYDNGDFLSDKEEAALISKMDALSDSHDIDVIILLERDLFDEDLSSYELEDEMLSYCRRFFSERSEKGNGVMLMISLDGQYRDYYFFSKGACEGRINNDRSLDVIEGRARPYIEENDFYNASLAFLSAVDERMLAPAPGFADYLLEFLPGTFIFGIIIGLITVFVMKAQLSSVKPKAHAGDYSVHDSFKMRLKRDIFLYKTVTKSPKPKNTSSGGGSRGGGGGGGRGGRC